MKKVIKLTLASCNIRTLLDSTSTSGRPERRTALVARELARYRVGTYAFWSGRSSDGRREPGVSFAIKDHLVKKLDCIPEGLNDCLMKLKFPLARKRFPTLISAYALTMTNRDEVKENFYEELEALSWTANSPQLDHLWTSTVGPAHTPRRLQHMRRSRPPGLGRNHRTPWSREVQRNGLLLPRTCATHGLAITNTMFRLPTRKKMSWMHPRSKHWHLIDYIIIRAKDRQDVRVTKALCGADCRTYHRLIIPKTKLHIQPMRRPQGQKVAKRLNTSKLKQQSVQQELAP